MENLLNKNVVYIGGFGGIGFASCKCFIQHGIKHLAIFDIISEDDKLQQLQALNKNVHICHIHVDLANKNNIESAFEEVHRKWRHIDVVVCGSGIMDERHIELTLQVNLLGVIYSTLAALRYMDKSQGGRGGVIVLISSVVSIDPFSKYAVYTASKWGVTGFGQALADPYYYERTQVSYITICPGLTETSMATRCNDIRSTFPSQPPRPASLRTIQTADDCAKNIILAILQGKNGSVWIVSAGKLKEHTFAELK